MSGDGMPKCARERAQLCRALSGTRRSTDAVRFRTRLCARPRAQSSDSSPLVFHSPGLPLRANGPPYILCGGLSTGGRGHSVSTSVSYDLRAFACNCIWPVMSCVVKDATPSPWNTASDRLSRLGCARVRAQAPTRPTE